MSNHNLITSSLAPTEVSYQWFKPEFWENSGKLVGFSSGRNKAYFVEHGEQKMVLRHYCRGGMIAKLSHDKYLYTGHNRVRCVAEFRLLEQMVHLGLPVPRPIAAHYQRDGIWVTGDILLERIPNAEDMQGYLCRQEADEGLWRNIGSAIAKLHNCNVYHADLNIKNIMFDGEQVYLIDFDNSGFKKSRGRWQQQNLARLLRSLRKQAAKLPQFYWREAQWQQLLDGYNSATSR